MPYIGSPFKYSIYRLYVSIEVVHILEWVLELSSEYGLTYYLLFTKTLISYSILGLD